MPPNKGSNNTRITDQYGKELVNINGWKRFDCFSFEYSKSIHLFHEENKWDKPLPICTYLCEFFGLL
jgi:hypothetical protein